MTKTILMASAAAVLLGGCSMLDNGPPPKRQPGSWSSKVEVTNVTGKDADKIKEQMNALFATMASTSECITPEMVAKEDPAKNMEKYAGGDCTFDQKDLTGKDISFSGTCKSPNGGPPTKISLKGSLASTSQDFTISVSGSDATGPHSMDMKIHSSRNGECTAKDNAGGMGGLGGPAAPPPPESDLKPGPDGNAQ